MLNVPPRPLGEGERVLNVLPRSLGEPFCAPPVSLLVVDPYVLSFSRMCKNEALTRAIPYGPGMLVITRFTGGLAFRSHQCDSFCSKPAYFPYAPGPTPTFPFHCWARIRDILDDTFLSGKPRILKTR